MQLLLTGDMDWNMADKVLENINNTKFDNTILLSSAGGILNPAFVIYRAIKDSNIGEKTIITTVECMSCAVMVLQAATYRYATEDCIFMLHSASFDQAERIPNASFQTNAEYFDKSNDLFLQKMFERSNIPENEWKSFVQNDHFLTTKEALELGLIDKIVDSIF